MDHLHPSQQQQQRRHPQQQQATHYQAQGSDGFGGGSSSSFRNGSSSTHDASASAAAAGQEAWLAHGAAGSPLDALMKGIHAPPASANAAASSSRSHIYNRAQALSRSTSIRRREPSGDASTDEQQQQSNEASGSGATDEERRREQVRRQRAARLSGQAYQAPVLTAAPAAAYEDDGPGPQRFTQSTSSSSTQAAPVAAASQAPSARDSTQLLSSSAFRNSVASDMSFNSLTGDSDRLSIAGDSYAPEDGVTYDDDDAVARAVRGLHLRRRGSLDTVRSSEFGDEGRWGKAWANKAYDEESIYGGSEWGGESEYGTANDEHSANMNGALSSLDELARGQGLSLVEAKQAPKTNAGPSLHSAESSHHVVSLTPSSARGAAVLNGSNGAGGSRVVSPPSRRDTIRSVMADVDELDASEPDYVNSRRADRDSMASVASVSTIRGGGGRGSSDGEVSTDGAHVYVWPPTPAASISSHGSGGRGSTQGMLGAEASAAAHARPRPDMQAWSAAVETMPAPASYESQQPQHAIKPAPLSQPRAPVGPSAVLARPLDSPILAPDGTRRTSGSRIAAVRGGIHGHPAGRAPPRPPTADQQGTAFAYADPNVASPSAPAPIGRTRAQAIRNADGRESIVSDLDVETLRLDNSSRRGSTSTIASSRMSVGTVHYDLPQQQQQQQQQANRRESLESLYAKRTSSGSTINGFSMVNNGTPASGYAASTRNGSFESQRQPSSLGSGGARSNEYAPRRAETQPTPPQSEAWAAQEELHRSNTHPRQPSWEAYPRQASAKPPLEAAYSNASTNSSVRTLAHSIPDVPTPASSGPLRADTRTGPTAAEEFLSQGITHHESGDMARSAYYFERSARVEGGCVVGMCMWGMALREGWGARRDQKKGFEWISRAAAKAGEMMSDGRAKSESELRSIRSELKLSVYELGKCFCYGWGVKMDKPMALEYFELAAKLGDVDSQAEAGALLAAGKGGCKKDLKKAAMYYRMAEAQGYELTGLSWVWKDKYNP